MNSSTHEKRKRISESLYKAYDRLLLLEEDLGRKIDVKKKSKNKDIEGFDDDKLSAISMRLVSREEKKAKELSFLIESGKHFIEEFSGKGKPFYKVDDVIVDLTKVIRDIKKLNDVDFSKLEKLQDMKKTFRYLTTAKTRADKAVKEIQKKREEARNKFKFDEFDKEYEEMKRKHEEELKQLSSKFGIPDDFDENIDQYVENKEELEQLKKIEAEYSTNAQKTEKEAKEVVRYIREVLSEYYDLPDHIIEQVRITIRSMGALAKVSKKASTAHIPIDVLRELMKDEKMKELLDPYVEDIDFSDKVTLIGATLPKWGTYFGEAHDKLSDAIEDIEEIDVDVKVDDKKKLEEGVVRDAIIGSLKSIAGAIKKVFKRAKGVVKSLKNNVFREGSNVENEIQNFKMTQKERTKALQSLYLDLEQDISEKTIDSIKESYDKKKVSKK